MHHRFSLRFIPNLVVGRHQNQSNGEMRDRFTRLTRQNRLLREEMSSQSNMGVRIFGIEGSSSAELLQTVTSNIDTVP